MGSLADELGKKIKNKKASVGIIGMGYVGIPLGLEFARNGFTVTGFDKDRDRVKKINTGKQVMKHIPASAMKEFVNKNKGSSTNKFSKIRDMDCLIICVPTPLDEHEQPDMSYVKDASKKIGKNLKKGQLVVLEST
ncbi:MAG: NAD(P)-binding domain-containing protein, partial [Dehalococcoidia bacterium]|nr:NAD(P)-binding domain-containing protein [Dehalococcoidia bacterium]